MIRKGSQKFPGLRFWGVGLTLVLLAVASIYMVRTANILARRLAPNYALEIVLEFKEAPKIALEAEAQRGLRLFVNDDVQNSKFIPLNSTLLHRVLFNELPARMSAIRLDPTLMVGEQILLHSAKVVAEGLGAGQAGKIILHEFPILPSNDLVAINLDYKSEGIWQPQLSSNAAWFFFFDGPLHLPRLLAAHADYLQTAAWLFPIGVLASPLLLALILSWSPFQAVEKVRFFFLFLLLAISLPAYTVLAMTAMNDLHKFRGMVAAITGLLEEQDIADSIAHYRVFESLSPEEVEIDVRSMMPAKSSAELYSSREAVIRGMWPAGMPLDRMPARIETIENPLRGSDVRQAQRLTIEMDYGLISVTHLLVPQNSANCLMLYHGGHDGRRYGFYPDFEDGKRKLLKAGCHVLSLSMPLYGANSTPATAIRGDARIRLSSHNDYFQLEEGDRWVLRFFLEPAIVAMNYALGQQPFNRVGIAGLSGGGWIATLLGAIDMRLKRVYPVAGSYPTYLDKSHPKCGAASHELELSYPPLLKLIDHFGLYALTAMPEDRRAIFIYNKYDSGCYPGVKASAYVAQLNGLLAEWGGGKLDIVSDDTMRRHIISPHAINLILDDFLR